MGTKFYKVSRLLMEKEPITEIKVEGNLKEIKEGVQANGKKYVQGELMDKQFILKFKKWDTSLEEFLKSNSLDIEAHSYCVQMVGKYEFFNGEPQLILGNSKVMSTFEREKVEEYIDCIPLDKVNNNIDFIENLSKTKIKDPVLYDVFWAGYEDTNKFVNAPYSKEVHSEKSGYFQHIINCLFKAGTMNGCPTRIVKEDDKEKVVPLYDTEVLYTSIMIYKAGYLDNIKVNSFGIITEENITNELLFGKTNNLLACQKFFTRTKEALADEETGEIPVCEKEAAVLHCVAALNGLVAPATLEAITVCNIVKSELDEWQAAKKISTVKPGEVLSFKDGGEYKNLVRI